MNATKNQGAGMDAFIVHQIQAVMPPLNVLAPK
jgi:hypothetical protein